MRRGMVDTGRASGATAVALEDRPMRSPIDQGTYDNAAMTVLQTAFNTASAKLGIDTASDPDLRERLGKVIVALAAEDHDPMLMADRAVALVMSPMPTD